MSYDIWLKDPITDQTIEIDKPHFMAGGTYAIGGTTELWLSITYNYGRWYRHKDAFGKDGIWSICGMSGSDSITVLERAIASLESMQEDLSEDEVAEYEAKGATGYWLPTRENAITPLRHLLNFAKMRPNGIWMVE